MIKLKAIADCSVQLEKARLDGSSGLMFGLLAYFIVERGRPVSRTTLAEYFWWNRDRREAGHCLRQAVYKLRRFGAPIETSGEHYVLGERAAVADFDCADERTLALSPLPPEEAVAVLPGFVPNASATFLTWLERTREKAGRSIRSVLVRALGDARRRNSWEEAAKLARQCLVLDPLNEEATLTLAEYTALQGNKREALRMIDGYIEEIGGTYADLRLPASLLRNRISERVAYPAASAAAKVPLIGREESLQVLANVAEQVSNGAGHTCVLHGPPGIGKTRLLTEFANISAMRGARIIKVECHADAIERPLAIFMELAPKLLRMPGALGCSPEALKLVKRLGSFDPNERLDPDEYGGAAFLHAAVRSSLRDLVDAIASERPLYLLVEDVHWIDRVSLEVLKELIGSNRERQLLVVMTTRTLGDGALLQGVDRRQLVVHEVPKLGTEKSHVLATSICNALAIQATEELASWCTGRSDGNPLYISELLTHWRETRDRHCVPASLEALLNERVGALDGPALYAMQAVTLMEGDATCAALEAVMGMPRWQVIGCIEQLEKAGLVALATQKIAARHSLIGDAAVAKMRESGAGILHRAIAMHLSADTEQGLTDSHAAWRAASHWRAAGATETALQLVTTVARHMASVGAVYEAAALIERSLALCGSQAERLRLLDERRHYLEAGGMSNELRENCRLAMDIEQQIAGSAKWIHSSNEIGYLAGGLYTRPSRELIAHALSCLESEGAALDHRLAAASIAMIAAYGDSDADAARRVVATTSSLQPQTVEERLHSLRTQLIYEFEFGHTARAVGVGDEYLSLYRRSSLGRLSQAVRISAYPHRIEGNFAIADARMTEALTLAQRDGSPIDEATALQWLATSATDRGDYRAAAQALDRLILHLKRYPAAADLSVRQSVVVIAAMTGNNSVAAAQLTLITGKPLPLHGRCAVLTAQSLAAIMAGERCESDTLDELVRMNDRLEGRPGQESTTIVIAMALEQRGQSKAAIEYVTRYVHETRRESWPSAHPILLSFLAGEPLVDPEEIRRVALKAPGPAGSPY